MKQNINTTLADSGERMADKDNLGMANFLRVRRGEKRGDGNTIKDIY